MKSLLTLIKTLRQGLGLETAHLQSIERSNGCVERAINPDFKEASFGFGEDGRRSMGDRALWSSAYAHATWAINHFSSHRATRMTTSELAYGRPFVGLVLDEVVEVLPNVLAVHKRDRYC